MTQFKTISLDIEDGLAILTLNRPEAKNAIDLVMRQELPDALRKVEEDPSIYALILTGSGNSFCAGGDISVMREMTGGAAEGRSRMRRTGSFAARLSTLDKPVIGAVDGPAYGAGFGMALATDFVLASPKATFCASFAKIGLVPDFGLHFSLPRRIGISKAKELLFSARVVTAAEAMELGLLYQLIETIPVLQAAKVFAQQFAEASNLSIGISKTLLDQSFSMDIHQVLEAEAVGQALCFTSDYHKDATERFLAKQPPKFNWPA